MRLEVRRGRVVWVRADGGVSTKPVSGMSVLAVCGFPVPAGSGGGRCLSLDVLQGDPLKDSVIMVRASGNAWWGSYLVSRITHEYVKVFEEDMEDASRLVNRPPEKRQSLKTALERLRRERRAAVDIKSLALEEGLKVWESHYFDGYWSPEVGGFERIPEGWDILPTGDAALTRAVRQGLHWVLLRRKGEYSEVVGTVAPAERIRRGFEQLGGRSGVAKREKAKQRAQKTREERMTAKLREAILKRFPRIPSGDAEEVLEECRRPGAVGTAQWIYFAPRTVSDDTFQRAAYLAVRAHVRHKYTQYDEALMETSGELLDSQDAKRTARAEVACDIERVLGKWARP